MFPLFLIFFSIPHFPPAVNDAIDKGYVPCYNGSVFRIHTHSAEVLYGNFIYAHRDQQVYDELRDRHRTEHLRRIGRIRMYGTALTRRWMDLLGDEKHYVTVDGIQVIPL